jgi:hypothetical protein
MILIGDSELPRSGYCDDESRRDYSCQSRALKLDHCVTARLIAEGSRMSLRGILRQEAEQKYLAVDERVQEAMLAVTLRPLLLYPLGWLLLNRDAYRAVICTDRRILLCKVDHATGCLEGLVQAEDRGRRLGPPRTPLMHRVGVFAHPVYVGRRFYKDVRRADAFAADLDR